MEEKNLQNKKVNESFEGDDFVKIDLAIDNLTSLPLQIFYYKEHGKKHFLINYEFNSIDLPISKVIEKLHIDKLFAMAREFDLKLCFKGFPRCIFERNILRPGLRWYLENQVFFVQADESSNLSILESCERCLNYNCTPGISKDYVKKFGAEEFKPLIANEDLYELNLERIEKFENEELKSIAKEFLIDWKNDSYYLRKKFVFVKSYPTNLEESSVERFVYYIYNRDDDFSKTYSLIEKYCHNEKLQSIRRFLEKANQIVISFAIMGDGNLRKSLYFSVEDLNDEELKILKELFEFEDDFRKNVGGIGIDFKEDKFSYKVYNKVKELKMFDLKNFVSEFKLEKKMPILRFANSLNKPLKEILFDYKYKEGKLFSKRIDISMQYNNIKLKHLGILLGINTDYFEDKEVYTLSFEIAESKPLKINFYYVLKLPQEDEFNSELKEVYMRNRYD